MSSSPFGFATRTSSLSLSLSLYSFLWLRRPFTRFSFVTEGGFVSRCPWRGLYLFPHPLSVVTSSQTSCLPVPEFSPPVPCFLPNCRPFRVYTYTSLPSVVKSNPPVVPCSRFFVCSFSLSLTFPTKLTLAKQQTQSAERREEQRTNVIVAIFAQEVRRQFGRTAHHQGGEGPADNERPTGR